MRRLNFVKVECADGVTRVVARVGDCGGQVSVYPSSAGRMGASIYIDIGPSSRVVASGVGPASEDAITDAEVVLRRDHPRAWELYASTVLVGTEARIESGEVAA